MRHCILALFFALLSCYLGQLDAASLSHTGRAVFLVAESGQLAVHGNSSADSITGNNNRAQPYGQTKQPGTTRIGAEETHQTHLSRRVQRRCGAIDSINSVWLRNTEGLIDFAPKADNEERDLKSLASVYRIGDY